MKQSLLSSWLGVSSTLAMTVGSPSAHRRGTMLKHLTFVLLFLFSLGIGSAWGATYELYSGTITEGDYIIYYNGYALKNGINSNRWTNESVTPSNNKITNPTNEAKIVWHIAASGSYWTLYSADASKYAVGTGTKNQGDMTASPSNNGEKWTVTGSSTYEFVNKRNSDANVNKNLRNNGTNGWACYSTQTGGAFSLYKKVASCTEISPTLSYTSTNLTIGGGSSSSPTLNKDGSTGTVTWESDDTDVATVNSNGVVTPVGTGTCNITASIAAAGGKCSGEVSVEFTVKRNITYYIGSNQYTIGGFDGETLVSTLPTNPSSCDGENYPYFYGWKNGSISTATTSAPTILTSETVSSSSAGNTYYAVFTDSNEPNYSTTYTSNVTFSGNTVVIGGTSYTAKKLGSNGNGGSFTVTVPSGTKKVYLHAQAWNGKNVTLTLSTSVGTISPNTARSLTANSALSGSGSSFTLTSLTNDYFEYTLSNVTSSATITIATASERGVVWGINASSGSGGTAHYITTCCTPLAQINGSVNASHFSTCSLLGGRRFSHSVGRTLRGRLI